MELWNVQNSFANFLIKTEVKHTIEGFSTILKCMLVDVDRV